MSLNRSQMLASIAAGTPVIWDGRLLTTSGQVPTQAEIDNQPWVEYYRNPLQASYQYVVNPQSGNNVRGEANSMAYAFATIQAALNKAAEDGADDAAVLVLPGTYPERLTLKSGIDLQVVDGGVATLEVDSAAVGDMVSVGAVEDVVARMLGKWRVRRLGASASGNNSLVAVTTEGSDVYIEFAEMYNGATGTNETQAFETGNGGKLRMKQIAPGLCQSLSYDLYVDYGTDAGANRSRFELDAWDLVECEQSIIELSGSFQSADIRIKAKRLICGSSDDMFSLTLLDSGDYPNIKLDISEYMYAPVGVVAAPNDAGILDISCPLIYSLAAAPIVFGGTVLNVRGADIVSAGTNIITVENVAGLLRFHNCRFFPTGTGRPVDTGAYEAFNCYTKIANATATIVGNNTTATGMTAPTSPVA